MSATNIPIGAAGTPLGSDHLNAHSLIVDKLNQLDTALASLTNMATPVGSPIPWLVDSIPVGFIEFAGQTISSATYPKLFAIFGATLPDLRGQSLFGVDSTHPIGSNGGASTVTLTSAQSGMPSHVHPNTTATTSGTDSPDHGHTGTTAGAGTGMWLNDPTHAHGNQVQIWATGSGWTVGSGTALGVGQAPGTAASYTGLTLSDPGHVHSFSTAGASARHAHSIPAIAIPAVAAANAASSHENLPPYRTVRWITVAA